MIAITSGGNFMDDTTGTIIDVGVGPGFGGSPIASTVTPDGGVGGSVSVGAPSGIPGFVGQPSIPIPPTPQPFDPLPPITPTPLPMTVPFIPGVTDTTPNITVPGLAAAPASAPAFSGLPALSLNIPPTVVGGVVGGLATGAGAPPWLAGALAGLAQANPFTTSGPGASPIPMTSTPIPSILGGAGTPPAIPGTTMVPVKNKAGKIIYEIIVSPAGREIAYYTYSKVKGWILHRGAPHRRMNPFNPHALSRADRRVKAFAGRSLSILRHMGFHVSKTRHTKVHARKRRAR